MDRSNIEKIAKTPEDRVLLAKLWDKINAGMRKNIPANTCFLSPRELEMTKFLFGQAEGLHTFGGYGDAERKMLIYLPEYLEEACRSHTESCRKERSQDVRKPHALPGTKPRPYAE